MAHQAQLNVSGAKGTGGNQRNLYDFEESGDEGNEGTPSKTTKKKDKVVKKQELAKVTEQLPAIHAQFPQMSLFKTDDDLSVKWHRCLICNRPYKVERRHYHYQREHGINSAQPCPADMKDSVQLMETMRASAATKYVFDCMILPYVTTQPSLNAYREMVTKMKESGIAVQNEQYLTQMETSLQSIHNMNMMQTPNQFSPSMATPFQQAHPFMQPPVTFNQPQFAGNYVQQTPARARRNIEMEMPQASGIDRDDFGNEQNVFDEFASHDRPIYQQNEDIGADNTNTLQGFNYDDEDKDISVGNYDQHPKQPSQLGTTSKIYPKLPNVQKPTLKISHVPLDSISSHTTTDPLPLYSDQVKIADLLDLNRDNPVRYQNPAGHFMYKVKAYQVMQREGLYRHLKIEQHPILLEYKDYLLREYLVRSFGRTSKSMEQDDIEQPGNKGGKQLYFQYIRKWGMLIQRARGRGNYPLTLDDLIFCGPIAQLFIEHLIEDVQHGGSTILQYCKSLLHCLEWVKAQKKMVFGPISQRGIHLDDSIAKCAMLVKNNRSMTELKRDADVSLGISQPKEFIRYGLAVEFINHNVFKEIMHIMHRSLQKPEFVPSRIQFNFILSYAMNVLLVTNSSRNELMYKMRNSCSIKENLIPVKVNNKTYFIGKYPNPKQGPKSTFRTKLYQGHFGVTEESWQVIELYKALRDRVIKESMLERTLLDPQSHFFRTYDLMPLSENTAKNFIKSCQTRTNFYGEISCNVVRHATSTLEFWCRRLLTGAQTTAVLLGHTEERQLMDYDEERVLKVAEAYQYLETMAKTDIEEQGDATSSPYFDDMLIPECFVNQNAVNELDEYELMLDEDIGGPDYDSDAENGELNLATIDETPILPGNADVVENVQYAEMGPSTSYEPAERIRDQTTDVSMEPTHNTEPEEHDVPNELETRKERKRPAEKPLSPAQIPLPPPTRVQQCPLDLTQPAVLNRIIKEHNEKPCGANDIPRLSMKNGDRADFINRRRSKPIQNWSWIAIYFIPELNGSGLFAKTAIAKNAIVADYSGLLGTDADYKKMTECYSVNHKMLADDYVVHIKLDNKVEMAIQAHMPVCDGRIIFGRFANHSRVHPNMETFKEEFDGRFYVYFRATRKIKEGEQLLWNYGKEYKKKDWYKGSCLCLKCSPKMIPDRTATLPLQASGWYADPLKASRDQGMTQAITQGHTPRSILGELVRRAGVDGITVGGTPSCWLYALKESVRIVGGGYLEPSRTPRPASHALQEALQQASHDAFVNEHPSVVVVRDSPRDKSPIMLLFGSVSSGQRFGNLAVYNQKHHEMNTLEKMDAADFKTKLSVIDELQGCTLVHVRQNSQKLHDLCQNDKVSLDDITDFAKYINSL